MTLGGPPPQLPPGTPLPGGSGVAGTMLYTWTLPPQIAWEGWIATGDVYTPGAQWAGTQLQAYYPATPPPDAPPPPEGGGVYTVIRVVPPGGWASEMW
jgi:hypothetical protein